MTTNFKCLCTTVSSSSLFSPVIQGKVCVNLPWLNYWIIYIMHQINVDISILMCLPTNSTFICTADRRKAIITAYHSNGVCISDIIRLLVHHSVTVSTSLLDTVGYNLQIGSLCFCVWDVSNFALGKRRVLTHVCVWHGEIQFGNLAVCECIITCRQQQITKHLPSPHLNSPGQCSAWLFHIDAGSAHVPGGWQLSAPPHLSFLHSQSLNCLALVRSFAEKAGTFYRNSTQEEVVTQRNVSMCLCACVCMRPPLLDLL